MPAFGLVVITAPKTPPSLLNSLLDRQMTVHLRKPGYATVDMRELLKALPEAARRNLVLHTCHELAEEFDIKVLAPILLIWILCSLEFGGKSCPELAGPALY